MEERGNRHVVVAAIAANLVIMASKYIAAAITGSSAMLSEAIHSTVDSLDGFFLLHGKRRSASPPDELHPFGHGKELYFWTLIVAILIFAAGGGMSVYEGLTHLLHPHEIVRPFWNYLVLSVAFISEAVSFSFAFRDVRSHRRGRGLWKTIRTSKDPTSFTVLFEDSAALLGLTIAFCGIFFGHLLRLSALDGIASLLIGGVLFLTAFLLARESRDLLVGESVEPEQLHRIRRIVESEACVAKVVTLLTMHLGPQDVLLTMDIAFRPELGTSDIVAAIHRLEAALRAAFPQLRRIYIEAASLSPERFRHAA